MKAIRFGNFIPTPAGNGNIAKPRKTTSRLT